MAGTSSVSPADAVDSQAASQAVVTETSRQVFTAVSEDGSVVIHDVSTTFIVQAGSAAIIAAR